MYILASEIPFLNFILLLLWITMYRIYSTIIKYVLQKRDYYYYYYYYYYLLTCLPNDERVLVKLTGSNLVKKYLAF